MSDFNLEMVYQDVGNHMDKILKNFKSGAKITVLVRSPNAPDGNKDFCLTNDQLPDAIKALQIRDKEGNKS